MSVPNPYIINIELFWPNGTKPNQNEIARVRAFSLNGATVDQGQSGWNPSNGGWQHIVLQNPSAFYPPNERPTLRIQVESTSEHVVHTTQDFVGIASGSTVKIIIGVMTRSWAAVVAGTKRPSESSERCDIRTIRR